MRASTGKAVRHRHAEEEREGREPHIRRREPRIEHVREKVAKCERQHHARVRDGDRRAAAPANRRDIELEPDEKHEEDDAALGMDAQQRHDRRWKQRRGEVGSHPAEQRRPEEDAADQLTDDRGLLDPLKQVADETRRGNDGGNGHQQLKGSHHFNGTKGRLCP
jgi:hypothetical protein